MEEPGTSFAATAAADLSALLSNGSMSVVATKLGIHPLIVSPMFFSRVVVLLSALQTTSAVVVLSATRADSPTSIWGDRELIAFCVIGSAFGAMASVFYPGLDVKTWEDFIQCCRRWVFGFLCGTFVTPLGFRYLTVEYTADLVMGWAAMTAALSYVTITAIGPTFYQKIVRKKFQQWAGVKDAGADNPEG